MRDRQRELREEVFSGRRVVRALSDTASSESASSVLDAPFGAAVTCLAEMASDSVNWLWGDVLALGKVTLLTGASGVGKSFAALRMVAGVTRGERDSRAETCGEPGQVLLISPEVELGDVVRPRLQAAGAEMSRVHALRGIRRASTQADDASCRAFQLDEDLRLLEHEIARRQVAGEALRLIVIDPFPVELFAYRYGTADLMRTLRDLAEIAAWSQAAILVVIDNSTRLSGGWGNLNKVLHSTAQSVWTVVENTVVENAGVDGLGRSNSRVFFPGPSGDRGTREDELEPEPERLLLAVKSNLKHKSLGLSFRLAEGRVEWHAEPVDMTAELYFARHDDRDRSSAQLLEQDWSELARATHWLKRRLKRSVTPLREIKRAADDHDISYSTLRRAFCGLNGVARRIGTSRLWGWALPEQDTESPRLPAWLNDDEAETAPASLPPHSAAPVQPETNEPARNERQRREQEPDEVVPLPGGGWTWRSQLEPGEDQSTAEVETFAATETRVPDS